MSGPASTPNGADDSLDRQPDAPTSLGSPPTARPICTVDGSGNDGMLRRGWCNKHYKRWREHGDPTIRLNHEAEHGTLGMYSNHGCRCEPCTRANADYHREYARRRFGHRPDAIVRAERYAAAEARDNHGTATRYSRGCRCRPCTDAATDARRAHRQRTRV